MEQDTANEEMGSATKARHSSASNEHYTPLHLVEAARRTLGSIDLDPASCSKANETVGAALFFSKEDDGFTRYWSGRVFVNPPGGRTSTNESSQKAWWFKLVREVHAGRVEAAIFVCFSVELLQTTQSKTPAGLGVPLDYPICFPAKRIAYVREDGKVGGSPPHSSCVVLVANVESAAQPVVRRFRENFSPIGKVVIPSGWPA